MKTRLRVILGSAGCAALHAALLGDLVERCLQPADDLTTLPGEPGFDLVVVWELRDGEEPARHLVPAVVPALVQRGPDLGARLANAFDELLARYRSVCIVGSDYPLLGPEEVRAACRQLEDGAADLVLGPALDGGYYLIGLSARSTPERWRGLFADAPWSESGLLAFTLERARAAGLAVALLPPAGDVDLPQDLLRLDRELRDLPPSVCPRTRAVLRTIDPAWCAEALR